MKTSIANAANSNPFTIIRGEEFDVRITYPAFAGLLNPSTHGDAFNALLTYLNTNPHCGKHDMERYWFEYMGDNDIFDKAYDKNLTPEEYMGLTDAECDLLFPAPDPF